MCRNPPLADLTSISLAERRSKKASNLPLSLVHRRAMMVRGERGWQSSRESAPCPESGPVGKGPGSPGVLPSTQATPLQKKSIRPFGIDSNPVAGNGIFKIPRKRYYCSLFSVSIGLKPGLMTSLSGLRFPKRMILYGCPSVKSVLQQKTLRHRMPENFWKYSSPAPCAVTQRAHTPSCVARS